MYVQKNLGVQFCDNTPDFGTIHRGLSQSFSECFAFYKVYIFLVNFCECWWRITAFHLSPLWLFHSFSVTFLGDGLPSIDSSEPLHGMQGHSNNDSITNPFCSWGWWWGLLTLAMVTNLSTLQIICCMGRNILFQPKQTASTSYVEMAKRIVSGIF